MAFEWQPHPGPQMEFCSRGEFEVLFGGAAGPGKTDCLIMEATRYVDFPDYRAILFRRTYPQLEEIIDRCWHWYPKIGGDYRAGEHRWWFPSGAKVKLSHMQHEDNKYDHQGKEYHFLGFDEVTQFTQTQYLYLHSRVRTTNPRIPKRIRSTTNPGGIGHLWCKERFVDIAKPGKTYIDPGTGLSRCFIPAKVTDNPTLVDNDPAYIAQLNALPELERLRLRDGVWDVFEGQVFVELSQKVHGCEPFAIPAEWEKFMVFDWGYSRPWAALWFAIDFDNTMYLYRAYLACKDNQEGKPDPDLGLRQTNSEIIQKIWELEKEAVGFRVADPACWAPTKLRGSNKNFGPSFVEDSGREGMYFIRADNDRIRGKQQVHERFKLEEEVDAETGEVLNEYPRFLAFNDCEHFWREFPSLREDPNNPEDVDTGQPDENYDCTRYAVMSRPIIPKKQILTPADVPGTFASDRAKYKRAKAYAQRHGVNMAVAYGRVR